MIVTEILLQPNVLMQICMQVLSHGNSVKELTNYVHVHIEKISTPIGDGNTTFSVAWWSSIVDSSQHDITMLHWEYSLYIDSLRSCIQTKMKNTVILAKKLKTLVFLCKLKDSRFVRLHIYMYIKRLTKHSILLLHKLLSETSYKPYWSTQRSIGPSKGVHFYQCFNIFFLHILCWQPNLVFGTVYMISFSPIV